MALDFSLQRTRGLDPLHAKSRNMYMVERSRTYVVGPMPAEEFLENFLPLARGVDQHPLLSSRNAFRSVPESANTVAEILVPLVR